jgi:hypothetical protein
MSIQEMKTDLNDMYQLRDLYDNYMFDKNTININSLDYELTHTPIVKVNSSNSLYLNCNEKFNSEKKFIHIPNNNNNNTPPFMLYQNNNNIPNPPYLNLNEIIKVPSITPKFVQSYEDRNNSIFQHINKSSVQNNTTYLENHQSNQLDLLKQWKNKSYKYIFDTYQKIIERPQNKFPFNKDYGDNFFDTTVSNSNSDMFDSDIYESDIFDSDVFDLDLENLDINENFNFKELMTIDYAFNELDSSKYDYAIDLQTFGSENNKLDMEISKIINNIIDQQNKYNLCLSNAWDLNYNNKEKNKEQVDEEKKYTNEFCTIGSYSKAVRNGKIARYRAKRSRRNFSKNINYTVRKTFADGRIRIGGRFATIIK